MKDTIPNSFPRFQFSIEFAGYPSSVMAPEKLLEQSSPKCAINDTSFVAHRHREGLPHWEMMG